MIVVDPLVCVHPDPIQIFWIFRVEDNFGDTLWWEERVLGCYCCYYCCYDEEFKLWGNNLTYGCLLSVLELVNPGLKSGRERTIAITLK